MAKRKISAKEAVADIRSGMDDPALMKKYNLPPDGLQSLFDKLIIAGFIDLSEMERRLRGFLGTVVITEYDLPAQEDTVTDSPKGPYPKSPSRIHAQQAARDIRLGLSDAALMEKYRLTSKGLKSLSDKLIAAGLITREEIGRRDLGIDHTVDLREEMLSLSAALRHFGAGIPAYSRRGVEPEPKQTARATVVNQDSKSAPSSGENHNKKFEEAKENLKRLSIPWFDRPVIVALLLIALFPLGFYALYRNSTFSTAGKVLMTVGWVMLAIACLSVNFHLI